MEFTAGNPVVVPAQITAGQSLSGLVRTRGRLVGIVTPAVWTAADLTFSADADLGGEIVVANVYDAAVERAVASASIPVAESRMLSFDLEDWRCIDGLYLRSGTAAAPVVQVATRTFYLILAG